MGPPKLMIMLLIDIDFGEIQLLQGSLPPIWTMPIKGCFFFWDGFPYMTFLCVFDTCITNSTITRTVCTEAIYVDDGDI